MEEYETYGGWLKKLDFETFYEISKKPSDHDWLVDDDGKLMSMEVGFIYVTGEDGQDDRIQWADDNSEGHFYSETSYTSGGTPIVRHGDEIRLRFYFQSEADSLAFKLRWQ